MSASTAAALIFVLCAAPLAAQQDPPTIVRDVAVVDVVEGSVAEHSASEEALIDLNRRILPSLGAGDRAAVDSLEGRFFTRMLSTQDTARCRALLRRLARNGTRLVPTLVLEMGMRGQASGTAERDERLLRYVHPAWPSSFPASPCTRSWSCWWRPASRRSRPSEPRRSTPPAS